MSAGLLAFAIILIVGSLWGVYGPSILRWLDEADTRLLVRVTSIPEHKIRYAKKRGIL